MTTANIDMEPVLKSGKHATREDGMCAMEFAAFLAGEPHSAHPVCVDGNLCKAVTELNDSLPSDCDRTTILMLLVKASIGTVGKGLDFAPAWMAYRDATAPALTAYEDAKAPAMTAYLDARAAAMTAYEDATASAMTAYGDATAPSWNVYKDAIASAWTAYKDAKALALKAYGDATAPAAITCAADLLAVIENNK